MCCDDPCDAARRRHTRAELKTGLNLGFRSTVSRCEHSRGRRSPGARNLRTEEWGECLSRRYLSSLVVLAEAFRCPVEVVAAGLDISKAWAFNLTPSVAHGLAPNVREHQVFVVKRPVEPPSRWSCPVSRRRRATTA